MITLSLTAKLVVAVIVLAATAAVWLVQNKSIFKKDVSLDDQWLDSYQLLMQRAIKNGSKESVSLLNDLIKVHTTEQSSEK